MAALLAVFGRPDGVSAIEKAAASAEYRGGLSVFSSSHVAIGVQSLGGDSALWVSDSVVVALAGYLTEPTFSTDGRVGETTSFASARGIAQAYLADGVQVLRRLRGNFVVLIHDRSTTSSYLLRSFGGRPMFHGSRDDKGQICFASEPSQVLRMTGQRRAVNWRSIAEYVTSHQAPPGGRGSYLAHVQRFVACTIVRIEVREGAPATMADVGRYWHPEIRPASAFGDERLIGQRLLAVLERGVVRHLSEQSGGLALSGGLDSSTLWGLLDRYRQDGISAASQVHAYSMVFPGMSCDETTYIKAHEARYGVRGCHVDMSGLRSGDVAGEVIPGSDFLVEPGAYTAIRLFRHMRDQGAKVVYTGVGGDEWFSSTLGYIVDLVRSGRFAQAFAVVAAGNWSPGFKLSFLRRVVSIALYAGESDFSRPVLAIGRHRDWRGPLAREAAQAAIAHRKLCERERGRAYAADAQAVWQWETIASEFIEQFCAQLGLDYRTPLIDEGLAEFCLGLHPRHRNRPGHEKGLLRTAMRGLVADRVLDRRERTTFGTPMLDDGALLKALPSPRDWLLAREGIIDGREVARLAEPARSQGAPCSPGLTRLSWFEHYIRQVEGQE